MDPVELDRLEYQTQHEATWQTLQAAAGQRDLVVKLHGGLLAVITVTGPALAGHFTGGSLLRVVLGYLSVGTLALGAMTQNFLTGVQSLRMLQFEMYSANRYSRLVLGRGQPRDTYFSDLIDQPEVRPLRQQRDPMGLIVQNVRHYLLADALFFPLAAAGALAVGRHGGERSWWVAAGLVVAVATSAMVRSRTDRAIRSHEHETTQRVLARYEALGVREQQEGR